VLVKTPAWVCDGCGRGTYGEPAGISTWHEGICGICGLNRPVTEPRDFGAHNPFPEALYEMLDKAVDIDALGNEQTHEREQGEGADKEADISIPFKVQEWMFEALADAELEHLHDLIDQHHDLIIEMARDRFREGYRLYGSRMYAYTSEERLREVLCELADAVCYLTSGPIE
jgi:hypothetical protein